MTPLRSLSDPMSRGLSVRPSGEGVGPSRDRASSLPSSGPAFRVASATTEAAMRVGFRPTAAADDRELATQEITKYSLPLMMTAYDSSGRPMKEPIMGPNGGRLNLTGKPQYQGISRTLMHADMNIVRDNVAALFETVMERQDPPILEELPSEIMAHIRSLPDKKTRAKALRQFRWAAFFATVKRYEIGTVRRGSSTIQVIKFIDKKETHESGGEHPQTNDGVSYSTLTGDSKLEAALEAYKDSIQKGMDNLKAQRKLTAARRTGTAVPNGGSMLPRHPGMPLPTGTSPTGTSGPDDAQKREAERRAREQAARQEHLARDHLLHGLHSHH